MEHLIAVFFATLGAADYLPISIAVIMCICLLEGIGIGVTVISDKIIWPTWCSVFFATYYVLACYLDGGSDG